MSQDAATLRPEKKTGPALRLPPLISGGTTVRVRSAASACESEMDVILAIDAAWTDENPSGVALVRCNRKQWECLAVAPSYAAFIGLAAKQPVNWNEGRFSGEAPDVRQLIKAATKLADGPIDLITIDMPVATVPIVSRRKADNEISREFGSRWCSAHSPNSTRPGRLGKNLTEGFCSAGFPLRTTKNTQNNRNLIEVYPHPALLSLLKREKRVPYKVDNSTTYWRGESIAHRKRNLLREFTAIDSALRRTFRNIDIPIPSPENVETLASLKKFEDALDALICAWVGVEFLSKRTVALGDSTAAIWCPKDVLRSSSEPADADLLRVNEVWSTLHPGFRAAILAIVEAAQGR